MPEAEKGPVQGSRSLKEEKTIFQFLSGDAISILARIILYKEFLAPVTHQSCNNL